MHGLREAKWIDFAEKLAMVAVREQPRDVELYGTETCMPVNHDYK